MFEEEIAKDIYMHHFDDDVNYPAVLNAITVGVQKGAEFGERQSGKKIEELKITDEYIIKTLESKVEKLQEDLRNKRISIKNKKAEIKELEEKISILLSCKNCPENKGGYICAKEYENKCLVQKIEFIKELQKENEELRNNGFTVSAMTEQQLKVALKKGEQLEKENAELKKINSETLTQLNLDNGELIIENEKLRKENAELKAEIENDRDLPTVAYMQGVEKQKKKDEKQLSKAKALLAKWVELYKPKSKTALPTPIQVDTEQFIKEIEK